MIEEIVNRKRLDTGNANGMYLLTGSQAFHLMKNVTQSLAGRASVIQMVPLGLDEILERETIPFVPSKDRIAMYQKSINISVKDVFELITKGMYPELYRMDQAIPDYYENYVNTYIDRDISELIHLKLSLIHICQQVVKAGNTSYDLAVKKDAVYIDGGFSEYQTSALKGSIFDDADYDGLLDTSEAFSKELKDALEKEGRDRISVTISYFYKKDGQWKPLKIDGEMCIRDRDTWRMKAIICTSFAKKTAAGQNMKGWMQSKQPVIR